MIPVRLIRAHFGADARRERGRDAGFQFAHPPLDFFDAFGREKFFRGVISQLQRVKALRFGGKIPRVEAEPGEVFVLLRREVELQPPPAFFAEAHVAAARVEQELQFLRRERGVAHVEHDLEIEPVHCRLRDVERDAAADGFVAERGEFAVQQHFDFRRQRFQPRDKSFRSFFREAQPPVAGIAVPFHAERFEQAREMPLRRAVMHGDDTLRQREFFPAAVSRLRLPALRREFLRPQARGLGDGTDDDVLALAAGVNRFQFARKRNVHGHGADALREMLRQGNARRVQEA